MTSVKQWELCDGCALGKQTRVSYMKSSPNRAKQVLEVIHSDVCGPMQTSTFSGKRYFVTFTDDKSHFCVVYLLRNKSEVAVMEGMDLGHEACMRRREGRRRRWDRSEDT
ncbi:hypothetical protein PC121_g25381 [Phytophthora cactorum]|nr:hypothetical protein PC120_g28664 [Phytophthora cactorum]KAG3008180.1 hypothetical protein PC121_g25381 [Phytophthora cactorum]